MEFDGQAACVSGCEQLAIGPGLDDLPRKDAAPNQVLP
jgi:hypothetical protein